jgi:hypothetical protein
MTYRCDFCRWQPSGAIDLYCMFHWAKRRVEDRVCCYAGCGKPCAWFVGRGDPVCADHGGRFPVAAPGPYPGRGQR